MKTFKDVLGDEWNVSVNIGEMRRMEERVKYYGLNVEITSPESVILRMQDLYFLADFLFVAVEPQAETRGITSKEFGYRLAGDVIADAKNALLEEYIGFFQDESQREKIRALAVSVGKIGSEILTRSIASKENAMEEIKERVLKEMEKMTRQTVSGDVSPNSAESAGWGSGVKIQEE